MRIALWRCFFVYNVILSDIPEAQSVTSTVRYLFPLDLSIPEKTERDKMKMSIRIYLLLNVTICFSTVNAREVTETRLSMGTFVSVTIDDVFGRSDRILESYSKTSTQDA